MYIRFKHSFAYTFPKAKNNPLKINYPGPGTYDPGEDNEMVNPPKWKFGMAPRDNKIHELSPGPAYYNCDLEYRKSSEIPNAPLYSFYKTSGVIPKKRKKKNSNKNYIKNIKKKNTNDSYLDDNNPGVGSYNLRSSLVVPVVKFGTERKDIGYKDTPSKGPASYDTRGNLGNFGPKINFGKDKRGKIYYSISPGPKYNMRYKDNDFPKFSFGKEVRMKESNFQKKKVKLERNFVKVKNYKKIYLYKEDNNVNVDQRKKGYVVSDYKLSQTGFPTMNFLKSINSNFQKNSKQYEDNKIDERENSRFDSFRKPAWVSRRFYKKYLDDLMKKEMKTKVKEKENKNKEEKKSFKKFRHREKGGSVLNLGGEEKLKEKKEIDIIDDKNNNQKYISPRNFRKKRFFFLNNNTKEENLSDKVEKETEEKESENKNELKIILNPVSPKPKRIKFLDMDDKPEPKKKEIEIKKNEENSNDSSLKLEQSDLDDSSLSSDEKDEVDEKVQENKASPRFTRNFVKKKTCGIVLGETETEETQPPESPRKHKKKNAPQIQVKIAMSKIPGVSEHLFNHITKRMTAILNRVKIPVFNIDDYVFNKKLGEGGYAVIFSVFRKDDEEQKQFALKKIIAKTLTEIDKFTKEFEIMHNCIHENIMKIYGICIRILDQTTYALYVLMELSERDWDKDIKNHIAKKKLYSEKKLINILRQLTSALLFMKQNAKISHRDIKPQNVLIFNGVYKLADFGEAKKANEISEMNTLRGTELFMSPVLYSGLKHEKNDVNHDPYKSDIFSLGFCFLYAATLNFDLLYKVRDIYNSNMMNKILEQNLKNKYSNTFIQILSKMLDTDESERFNFEELAEFVDNKYDKEGNLKEEENNNENFTDNKKGMNNALMNRIKKFKK